MISRDGALISLWQESADYLSVGSKTTNNHFDVIIVGGGITGISLGILLQNAGKKCLILEANNLCFGTTGGTTAHLNTFMDTPYTTLIKNFGEDNARLVAEAAKEAIGLIKHNIEKYAIQCGFEYTSGYLFAQNEKQEKELEAIAEACGKVGVEVFKTTVIPIPIPFSKAVEFPGQAKFSPVQYVMALAKEFIKMGGTILEQSRVVQHTQRKDQIGNKELIDVQTQEHTYTSPFLVYATHTAPGVNMMHFRCAPYRSYVIATKLKNSIPSDISDMLYPEGLCYDMFDPYHYYRSQEINGEMFFIAGGEDHKTAHESNTEQCFRKLESHVREHFDVEKITHKWSSQYYEPTDGLPYIGHLPGTSGNIFVATGYGGNGMIYSQVAAIMLTHIILNGESRFESLFDPGRVKPLAGFSNFVKENSDVVRHLIGSIFSAKKIESLSELAHGDAKIIDFDNHKIALFKSREGRLYALNPACTHIKCTVAWNAAEQSWDCPCHGARYSPEGKVLNGPAHIDLRKIELKD
jgi:glycine/D-amino acid oxidase-like deaminating enzyme/nitrite reductase/ring-hydroxylating ferredoxin subunit